MSSSALQILNFFKSNPGLIKIIDAESLVAQFDKTLSSFENGAQIVVEYSDFLINIGRFERARDILQTITDSDQNNYMAYHLIAKCHYLQGSLKEAQYPIIRCLELNPNYDEGRFLLAKIFLKARQFEKAQKIFEFYQNIDPFRDRAEVNVAKCLYYAGGSEAAAVYADRLIRDASRPRPYLTMVYAYHLSNVGDYDRAFAILYDYSLRSDVSETERSLLSFMNIFLLSMASSERNQESFVSEAKYQLQGVDRTLRWMTDDRFNLYKNFAETVYNMKIKNFRHMNECAEIVLSYRGNYAIEDYVVFDFEEFVNIFKLAGRQGLRDEAHDIMASGCMHISAGNLNAGVRYLESAVQKFPEDIVILEKLGEAYTLVSQNQKAIAVFTKIKALDPKNIDAYRRTSEIYMSSGDSEKFISECRQILALDPSDYFSRYYIGEFLFTSANYKEAEEFMKFIVTQIENDIKSAPSMDSISMQVKDIYEKAAFILAQIAFKDNHRENAILYLNTVINVNPENEKAFDLLNRLKQSRQDREIMVLLRDAEQKEADLEFSQAMQLYESIIEINPRFIEAHYRISKNLIKQNNFDRALFELERIFDYECGDYERINEVHLAIALLSYEAGKNDRCRESLSSLAEISNDPSVLLMLLYMHKISFLASGASQDYDTFLARLREKYLAGQRDFNTCFALGYTIFNTPKWIFEDQSVFASALEAAEAAAASDTADLYARYCLALALEKSGEIDRAFEIYNDIAQIDLDDSPDIAYTRQKYSLINNPQGLSFSFYKFLLPENLDIKNFIHSAILKSAYRDESNGAFDAAIYYYGKSLRIVPDNSVAAMKCIDLYLAMALTDNMKISKISTFIKTLKKDISAHPDRADLRFQLGYLYFKLPDELDVLGSTPENVVMEIKHSISIDNKYLPAYAALRLVYEKMGATDKKMYAHAVDLMKKAFDAVDNRNPYLNIEMGDCYYYYYGQDMKGDALEYYRKSVSYRADLPDAHFKIASILRIKKDYEKAILHYGIVYDLDPTGPYSQESKKSIATLKRRHMIE